MEVMVRLRSDGGCPWDREQTWASLRRYVLEEAHELVEAVDRRDPAAVREECGDLLLEVVFMARIAEEDGHFGMAEVARGIRRKLIRRHPHVFGGGDPARNAGQALESWEAVKAREERREKQPHSVTDGVPATLPALLFASKVLDRLAARAGRRTAANGPGARMRAALRRMEAARRQGADPATAERALGELLLEAAAWARSADLDPEAALRGAVRRLAGTD